MGRRFLLLASIFIAVANTAHPASAPATTQAARSIPFDTYSGYFVSNKFEPDKADSFVVLRSQKEFDAVFGVAMVMGDKSHRLPADTFDSKIAIAVIKRGTSLWEFKVAATSVSEGVLTVAYTSTETKEQSCEFACPLIVSVPRGDYTSIVLEENGKQLASKHPG